MLHDRLDEQRLLLSEAMVCKKSTGVGSGSSCICKLDVYLTDEDIIRLDFKGSTARFLSQSRPQTSHELN